MTRFFTTVVDRVATDWKRTEIVTCIIDRQPEEPTTVNGPNTKLSKLLRAYQLYLDDSDTATFVATIATRYSLGTLCRLTVSSDAVTRRASVLAIGFLGNTEHCECIGERLNDPDRRVRLVADDSMKAVWSRHGSPRQRQRLGEITRLLQSSRYVESIELANQLIEDFGDSPDLFCQRGLSSFYLSDVDSAIKDCRMALSINRYHYTAAIGLGHCYLEKKRPVRSLEYFRMAMRIYPDIEQVNVQINRLERTLQKPN